MFCTASLALQRRRPLPRRCEQSIDMVQGASISDRARLHQRLSRRPVAHFWNGSRGAISRVWQSLEHPTSEGGIDGSNNLEAIAGPRSRAWLRRSRIQHQQYGCLLYTSDAADEEDSVDLGGRRIIKKKKKIK